MLDRATCTVFSFRSPKQILSKFFAVARTSYTGNDVSMDLLQMGGIMDEEENTERKTYIFASRMASHAARYFAYIVRVLSIRMVSVRGCHVSLAHSDYESTWIFLFFLMFLHLFRFVAPIAMIKIQCEHCTCTKSLSIHFCINFLLPVSLALFPPATRTKRFYYINLLRIPFRIKTRSTFRWIEKKKLCQRQHRSHLRVTLAFCSIESLRGNSITTKGSARRVQNSNVNGANEKLRETMHEFCKSRGKSFKWIWNGRIRCLYNHRSQHLISSHNLQYVENGCVISIGGLIGGHAECETAL